MKNVRFIVVILICLLAVYLRIDHLNQRQLWNDENFQYHQSTGPFKPVWKRETYGDMTCFPGDYLITYPFVRAFGMNKWGLMIPHLVMTMLGFYFLYRIGERYFKTIAGFLVSFLIVCFNQYLIFHSLEFRPYGALATQALMAFYYADILWNERAGLSIVKKFLIGLVLTWISWFHAFGVLMVFCSFLFIGLSAGVKQGGRVVTRDLRNFFLVFILVAGPVWLWYATGNPLQFSSKTYAAMSINTFTYIQNPLDGFWSFFNRTVFYHLVGFKRLYFLLGALVFLAVIPMEARTKKWGFFLAMVLLPIAIILSVDLRNGYWFLVRQYIYTAPLMAFFLGWVWDSAVDYYLDKSKRRWTARYSLGLILLIGCATAGTIGIFQNIK